MESDIADFTMGFMKTNMTGFQRIELLDICSGNTVKDVGIAWKIRFKNVLNECVKKVPLKIPK